MITRIGMAARRSGSTLAEFQSHWRNEHATAALLIPTLRAYVQNHAVLDGRGRPVLGYPGFDACAETTYDDLASMDVGFASPQYQRDVRADEAVLIDKSTFFLLLCSRDVLFDDTVPLDDTVSADGERRGGPVKLMTFVRVHPMSSRDRLLDIAAGPYARAVRESGAARHEQLVPLPDAHQDRQPAACDLVDSVTFADTDSALDFVNGPGADAVDALLAGVVFGRERLLASPRVIKALDPEDVR